MKRDIYAVLQDWKNSSSRRPLIIRGARQTGKTYIVNELGRNEFRKTIYLNLERNREYQDIFRSYDPVDIIENIALFTGNKVEAGTTLLFIDEIQECPDAIISLRYLYEELPELHVIAAGSLLEFSMKSVKFKMPVGRIQYLFLYPLSFGEFLDAMGESDLRNHIQDLSNLEKIPESLHNRLISHVKRYMVTGGMPAVVQEYVTTRDIIECQRIQRSIIDTYLDDFAKYARDTQHKYLRKVFHAVPGSVGKKFVYARVDRETKSRELKEALELLETAGVVIRIRKTSGTGIPLMAGVHESYFKMIFLDVGLFQAISGIYSETAMEEELNAIYKGALTEQFVGQQLTAMQSPYTKAELYYWGRQEKNSIAEIDYLIEKQGKIIPIEVKSGPTGHLKSMQIFIRKFKSGTALKISQSPYMSKPPLLSLPFYAIESWMRSGLTTSAGETG